MLSTLPDIMSQTMPQTIPSIRCLPAMRKPLLIRTVFSGYGQAVRLQGGFYIPRLAFQLAENMLIFILQPKNLLTKKLSEHSNRIFPSGEIRTEGQTGLLLFHLHPRCQ